MPRSSGTLRGDRGGLHARQMPRALQKAFGELTASRGVVALRQLAQLHGNDAVGLEPGIDAHQARKAGGEQRRASEKHDG